MVLLKNAVCIEESQRGVKKVHFLLAILTTSSQCTDSLLVSVLEDKDQTMTSIEEGYSSIKKRKEILEVGGLELRSPRVD